VPSIRESGERVAANVERVIVGKHREVRTALVALLCQGHLLIEDVPGTGKTMLAKAISRSLGCTFRRIQFTPDLLPTDVTGLSIYNQKTQAFEFRPGPVVSQIVLADEINRATPKTQSALLECMEERHMTVDGVSLPMPVPFMVIATQNPIEYEGTFPLPEAQVDRFLLRMRMGYPEPVEEMVILDEQKRVHPLDDLRPVAGLEEVLAMQKAVREIYVDPSIADYIVRLVGATRVHPDVYLGASPRGSLALYRAGQAAAALSGRDYVIPDDVKALAEPTLAHRIILKTSASMRGMDGRGLVAEVLASVPVEGPRSVAVERGVSLARQAPAPAPRRAAAAQPRGDGAPRG
jgi:MoxR-like ATPase